MNEKILYEERPVMFGNRPFLFVLLLLLTPLIIGALCLLAWYLGVLSNKLTVTDSKMRLEQGLLSKRRKEITLANVRSVEVYQTFLHRIMKTGQIRVYTIGDLPEIVLGGLPDPLFIKQVISEQASQ